MLQPAASCTCCPCALSHRPAESKWHQFHTCPAVQWTETKCCHSRIQSLPSDGRNLSRWFTSGKQQSTHQSSDHAKVFGEVHAGFLNTRCMKSVNLCGLVDETTPLQCKMHHPQHFCLFSVGQCWTKHNIENIQCICLLQFMYGWNSVWVQFQFIMYSFVSSTNGCISFMQQPSHRFRKAAKHFVRHFIQFVAC